MNPFEMQLLFSGTEAFPVILNELEQAKDQIEIHMFIWRNDGIGKQIARKVLEAADRGVKVHIVKDRYGTTCEYMEEDQTSMFHETLTLSELLSVRSLELMYHPDLFGKENLREANELRDRMLSHPNIRVDRNRQTRDHAKFYVFDERILILGGINIEDKEADRDREGRIYRDYMVRIEGEEAVRRFRARRKGEITPESEMFVMNLKEPVRRFEVKAHYLDLIEEAREELTILMAYFAPLSEFTEAIRRAAERGVRVRILIPEHANVADDLNRYTMSKLYGFGKGIRIFLSPYMTHTKLLVNEKRVNLGSCNITRNAFAELDELNFEWQRDGSAFIRKTDETIEELISSAHEVSDPRELSFHPLRVLAERAVM